MYLSRLLGQPVRDGRGTSFARVHDLLLRPRAGEPYPPVAALIVQLQRRALFIPWGQVARYDEAGVALRSTRVSMEPFTQRPGEVRLAGEVMDRQLIDISGRRVVRTNDLWLEDVDGRFRLLAVDVGFRALFGRIAPGWLKPNRRLDNLLDWAQVETMSSGASTVQLKLSRERLTKLHPVELAHIVEQLTLPQGADFLESLEDEIAADVLQEMDSERQVDLIEQMDAIRAPRVIEEMDPDEAADLLGDLEPEYAEKVLAEMDSEAAADLRSLMAYPDNTAGGLMTTAFVAVPQSFSVAQTIASFRTLAEPPEVLETLFVTVSADDERLVGAVSLRDLLFAEPEQPIAALAGDADIIAHPFDSAEEVAQLIAEYDVAALPVVDGECHLLGVVTVDDAIDILAPQSRRRLPRVFR